MIEKLEKKLLEARAIECINILEDSNTVFNIQGKGDGAYQDSKYFSGGKFSTSLTGDANIRVGTKDNTIYAILLPMIRNYLIDVIFVLATSQNKNDQDRM